MIRLRTDCLVFETASGAIPCSAEQVALELLGEAGGGLDPDLIKHAVAGVLRYFKEELGRDSVTVNEFSEAMARVLRGFGCEVVVEEVPQADRAVLDFDLRSLACASGTAFELGFFPRLRQEIHDRLDLAPQMLRVGGLEGCVKQLLAARRWCPRCRQLRDQIVEFIRLCLREAGRGKDDCALLVR